ncbi:MAG: tRNA epoxyqueuosine(34) reductase QueG [Bacteroidales bacterium]|nr:tRNA epoxyqueuosine(34) reductase QueG [Bacteroidales bacterium]
MKSEYTKAIKAEAARLGFSFCGITKAEFLKEEKERFGNYLKNGFNGDMMYMQNNSGKRLNPALHVENAKSVILVLQNYFTGEKNDSGDSYIISKYAHGKDYHIVIKNKLEKLLDFINKNICKTNSMASVDSAPVLEKALAEKAGLGWRGKNTILINKTSGSFHFIGEIITDLELDYDKPAENLCGSCNKCIEACPTKALIKPHVLDARKCIAYLTISSKKNIPEEFQGKLNNRIYGCDICQDICPWNKFSKPTEDKSLNTIPEIKNFTKDDWQKLTKEDFEIIFKESAIKRAGYEKFVENIKKA